MNIKPITELPGRYKWSHRHWFHRTLVKLYNSAATYAPFKIKYGIGKMKRQSTFPYTLINPGDVVVQVGAPNDTLRSGRSRGMYFSLFAGESGKVVLVEPDAASETAFNKAARKQNINNILFKPTGAWSEKKDLAIYIDRKHPATNFTEGQVEWDAERMKDFQKVVVPADTIDNILDSFGITDVKLVSITTNGSEEQIIAGMARLIQRGLPYLCTALTDDYTDIMTRIGYKFYTYDDRGQIFIPELANVDDMVI